MTATYGAAGTTGTGTTTANGTYPTGITAGMRLVMEVGFTNNLGQEPDAPAGWTKVTAAVGLNSGVAWYVQTATGSETGTVAVTNKGTTNQALRVLIHRISKTLAAWAPEGYEQSEDTTADTSYAATNADFDPGATTGDLVLYANALATSGTPTMSSVTNVWTGVTTTRTAGGVGTTGSLRLMDFRATVDSGTSTAPPKFTATLSVAAAGITSFLRLRDVAAIMSAGPDQVDLEPGKTCTLNSSASVGVGGGGRLWTQISGTTVTLSSTTAVSPTFRVPAQLTAQTLRFRCTDVTSGLYDEVDIQILRASRKVKMASGYVGVARKVQLP